MNTIAGGGSLLTLPALIFLGMPASLANGTNRLGILVQSVTAAWSFHRLGALEGRAALSLVPVSILGGGLGAWVATLLDESALRRAMAGVMLLVLALLWLQPEKRLAREGRVLPGWLTWLVFLGIGFYGGFIQAGVGVLILVGLQLCRSMDLVRGNGVKVLLTLVFTVPALLVFLWQGEVAWLPGLVLALSSSVGAELGARWSVKKGPGFIRLVLTGVVIASAIKLVAG